MLLYGNCPYFTCQSVEDGLVIQGIDQGQGVLTSPQAKIPVVTSDNN